MLTNPEKPTRTIHPDTLKEMPLKSALALLEVARDLRSGAIPKQRFQMKHFRSRTWCGTAYCIAGWAIVKSEGRYSEDGYHRSFPKGVRDLFASDHPSDPKQAADAIERYIYDHAQNPWTG